MQPARPRCRPGLCHQPFESPSRCVVPTRNPAVATDRRDDGQHRTIAGPASGLRHGLKLSVDGPHPGWLSATVASHPKPATHRMLPGARRTVHRSPRSTRSSVRARGFVRSSPFFAVVVHDVHCVGDKSGTRSSDSMIAAILPWRAPTHSASHSAAWTRLQSDVRSRRESWVGGVPGKPPRFAGRVKQFGTGRMVERPVHSKPRGAPL